MTKVKATRWLRQAQDHLDLGDLPGAEAALLGALDCDPQCVPALFTLGNLHLGRGDAQGATAYYQEALALDPAGAPIVYNLGVARHAAGDLPGALERFRQALALDPALADAAANLASLTLELEGPAAALPLALQALALDPQGAGAHNTLGAVREWAGEPGAALASYRQAVALDPASPDLRFNLATVQLLFGQWQEGWANYEARLGTPLCPRRDPVAPRWQGQPLAGKRLLVLAEQGLGDTLQFSRYLPLIPGGELVFLVQPGLGPFLAALHPGVKVREWDLRAPLPRDLGAHWQIPLLSLPGLLGTTAASIPPPLPVPSHRPPGGPGLRIGLVLSGNANNPRNRFRACPFEALAPLLDLPGLTFHNLQQGPAAAPITADPRVLDLAPGCRELPALAEALGSLDLLLSTDTMPAHLAGALGVPVWLLLDAAADWRWQRERADSPWYPSMRLFRQPAPGAWPEVVAVVARALRT